MDVTLCEIFFIVKSKNNNPQTAAAPLFKTATLNGFSKDTTKNSNNKRSKQKSRIFYNSPQTKIRFEIIKSVDGYVEDCTVIIIVKFVCSAWSWAGWVKRQARRQAGR